MRYLQKRGKIGFHREKPLSIRLPATFRALRHYNFRLWFFGQGISLIGTWMQTMAQQVLVYRLTGSAAALGIVAFAGLIPLIPFSLLGGSIVDRLPKRSVILVTQVGMLLEALILAVLVWTNTIQVWHVYLLSLISGIFNAVDMPARQAFVVDMVEGRDDLPNAIGLGAAMFNAARAIGPALAGVVVAVTGEGWAFFINGMTFVAVIISLILMRNLPASSHGEESTSRTLDHMRAGLRFVFKSRLLLVLFSLVGISAFLSMPYHTLMPVYAGDILNTSAQPVVDALCHGPNPLLRCQSEAALPLGILLATVGIGALIGALLVASLPGTARYGIWLTVGNVAFPLLLLVFSANSSFLAACGLLFFVGVSFVWQNALANTLLQLGSPDALRGRVMSLFTLIFAGMMRLGSLQAGFVSDWIGPRLAVGIGAAVSLVYGLFVAVRYPEVRKR